MNYGFVKLYRSILDWEWYQDVNTKSLYLHLLLKANHEPKRWMGIEIGRGQLVTGRKQLSVELGMSERA